MATAAIIEFDTATGQREISAAWEAYQQTEKYGLEFGRVCCEWRDKFSAQGSRSGKGLRPILDKVGIPRSTAYWWMDRYEVSVGAKQKPGPSLAPPRSSNEEAVDRLSQLREKFANTNVQVERIGPEEMDLFQVWQHNFPASKSPASEQRVTVELTLDQLRKVEGDVSIGANHLSAEEVETFVLSLWAAL